MDALYYLISHNAIVFFVLNGLELMAGILLLVPAKRRWQEYLIAIYGGFLFGMIPLWYLSENVVFAMIGSIILAVMFGFVHNCYGKQISLPFAIFLFRLVLMLAVTIWSEEYYENPLECYGFCMFLSLLLSIGLHIIDDPTSVKCSRIICPIFGIWEVSGVLVYFYRMDYHYFLKELQSGDIIPFFLYMLKIDFWIVADQFVYLFLVIGLLVMYLPFFGMYWKKIRQEQPLEKEMK